MSYICDKCGKGIVIGRSQKHQRGVAGKRWHKRAQKTARTFKPNLQKADGKWLCAKCLKTEKKEKRA